MNLLRHKKKIIFAGIGASGIILGYYAQKDPKTFQSYVDNIDKYCDDRLSFKPINRAQDLFLNGKHHVMDIVKPNLDKENEQLKSNQKTAKVEQSHPIQQKLAEIPHEQIKTDDSKTKTVKQSPPIQEISKPETVVASLDKTIDFNDEVTSALLNAQEFISKLEFSLLFNDLSKQIEQTKLETKKSISNLQKTIDEYSKSQYKGEPLLANARETLKKLNRQLEEIEAGKSPIPIKYSNENEGQPVKPGPNSSTQKDDRLKEQTNIVEKDSPVQDVQKKLDDKFGSVFAKINADILQKADRNVELLDEKAGDDVNLNLTDDQMKLLLHQAEQKHSKQLEDFLHMQRKLHEIETDRKIEEAIKSERNQCSKKLDLALAEIFGIESALNTQQDQNLESRQAKLYWDICQNLRNLIENGNVIESKLNSEINAVGMLSKNEGLTKSLIDSLPEHLAEISSKKDLAHLFDRVYTISRKFSKIRGIEDGILNYLQSFLHSFMKFEIPIAYDDKEIVINNDPSEIISIVRHFVQIGDYLRAIRIAQLLDDNLPSFIFNSWIMDTKKHLEVSFLTELLTLNLNFTSIRAIT